MAGSTKKSLGQAIDVIIAALNDLESSSRLIAVKAACEHLDIPFEKEIKINEKQMALAASSTNEISVKEQLLAPQKIIDIRTLTKEKQPKSTVEMACVVAYYLGNYASEKKHTITAKDIETYFKQGDYRLPKVLNQVLIDAKAAGYFDSPKRGIYKLNPVGHNLVVHSLPKGKK